MDSTASKMHLFKSKERHRDQVSTLQRQLQNTHKPFSLKKAGPSNTLRNGDYKAYAKKLDLTDFTSILEWNPEECWILVEPRITFDRLCRYTLSHGFVPLVVPEFKSITVGGAIMGAALESSSHRYGQFNDTCLEYECLLGNGELIYASATQHADLFYACSGSYGTLAILTSVKLKIRKAKPWIHLTLAGMKILLKQLFFRRIMRHLSLQIWSKRRNIKQFSDSTVLGPHGMYKRFYRQKILSSI
jgi:Delta24-sterol reductase